MKRDFIIVVKGVIVRDNKVLLLHRSEKEMENSIVNRWNAWDLPGGGVQFFETTEKALHREIMEETCLEVELKGIVNVYDIIRQHVHAAVITYFCMYTAGNVVLSEEHDKYYWIDENEIEDLSVPKWLKKYFNIALCQYKNI